MGAQGTNGHVIDAAAKATSEVEAKWYLVRTKAGQERIARDQVSRLGQEVLLPMLKVRVRRWGRMVESVAPLFPCYLFAELDYTRDLSRVRCTRGVRDVVHFGLWPADVPRWVVEGIKERCGHGPIELAQRRFLPGEPVKVVDGPLRGFEGIFQYQLSGAERVAILLNVVGGARAVMPARMVDPAP